MTSSHVCASKAVASHTCMLSRPMFSACVCVCLSTHTFARHTHAQEALRLKEAKAVDEVVAVSLGPQQAQVSPTTH